MRQLALPFAHSPRYDGVAFLPAESNADARRLLDHAESWPNRRLAIWGGEGRGKTHLLHRWAAASGAVIIGGAMLPLSPPLSPPLGPIGVDDADLASERLLLHLLNAAGEAGVALVLTSRRAPARWAVALPDLASRLRAMLAVELGAPEDSLLRALLARLLADRGLKVSAAVQEALLTRLPRTAAAMREAALLLDRRSLESGGPVTRALGVLVAAEINGEDVRRFHDDVSLAMAAASPSDPGFL